MATAAGTTYRSLVARARAHGQQIASWASHTPVGRALHRFNHFRGTRLAGTVTFYGFLSVFPILVLAFSVTLRVVGTEGVAQLEDFVEEFVPGISDQLALQRVRTSASSLQVVGAVTLLVTGLGWVDATRASVRSMWGLPDRDGSFVGRKLRDLLALIGLGILVALSLLATTWASGQGERLLQRINLDDSSAGQVALNGLAQALAWVTATLIVGYVIAGLPRIRIPWTVLVPAALVGGIVLELLKHVLIGYISGVASNNTYGAFGVPIALLVWIYVIARLLMVVAAWTAERCGAPLVQPRFVEAAAAMQAAGDPEADAQPPPAAQGGPTPYQPEAGLVRGKGFVLGAIAGVVVGAWLGRRRG